MKLLSAVIIVILFIIAGVGTARADFSAPPGGPGGGPIGGGSSGSAPSPQQGGSSGPGAGALAIGAAVNFAVCTGASYSFDRWVDGIDRSFGEAVVHSAVPCAVATAVGTVVTVLLLPSGPVGVVIGYVIGGVVYLFVRWLVRQFDNDRTATTPTQSAYVDVYECGARWDVPYCSR